MKDLAHHFILTRLEHPMSLTVFSGRMFFSLVIVIFAAASPYAAIKDLVRDQPDGFALIPGWHRIQNAAVHAATDPWTWGPAAAAAGVYLTGSDAGATRWIATHAPIFGSVTGAQTASNVLLAGSAASFYGTGLAGMVWRQPNESIFDAGGRIIGGVAASGITSGITNVVKSLTGRLRPDGSDHYSFPSGHTSSSSVYTTLACRNIQDLPLSRPVQLAMQGGVGLLTVGTAWARMEGEKHFLTDVLAGAALGHFVGIFISDAFFGVAPKDSAATDSDRPGIELPAIPAIPPQVQTALHTITTTVSHETGNALSWLNQRKEIQQTRQYVLDRLGVQKSKNPTGHTSGA